MGCTQWKTVRFKVRSFPVRSVNSRVDWLLEGSSSRPQPTTEQLLRRLGQLKLDPTGSHDGRERPSGPSPTNGRLETLFQSVIL